MAESGLVEQAAAAADTEATDARLAARARTNPRAFAALYERYVVAVHRYCYRRLGSREAAEEATSRTFIAASAALRTSLVLHEDRPDRSKPRRAVGNRPRGSTKRRRHPAAATRARRRRPTAG